MTTRNSNIPSKGAQGTSPQKGTIPDARLTFLVERALLDDTPSPDVEVAFQACRCRIEAQEKSVKADGEAQETTQKPKEASEDATVAMGRGG